MSDEESTETGGSGFLGTAAILFFIAGGIAGVVDGYSSGGLVGALVLMPISAVFIAVLGVTAVYLRGLIAACLLPFTVILISGVVAYDLIWGLPDTNVEDVQKESSQQESKGESQTVAPISAVRLADDKAMIAKACGLHRFDLHNETAG